jgi:hypothetical protein
MIAASIVTTTPTSSGTRIARVSTTLPVFGRSIPNDLKSAFSRPATPMPASTPSPAPSTAITSASRSTDVRT